MAGTPDRLEPLKTLHETRKNDQYVEALVFEIPAKLASRAVSIVKPVIQEATPKPIGLHHLRKLIHLPHLPKDLLERRLVVTRPHQPSVFLLQAASQDLASNMLDALKKEMDQDTTLSLYDHLPRCFPISVPLHAPLSDTEAKLWSERYWPSIYNPASQVLQDAPPLHQLRKVIAEQNTPFTDHCVELTRMIAEQAFEHGLGRAAGAVVVDPVTKQVVAVAGDCRWVDESQDGHAQSPNGRPEYHALMRVISMVANKELQRRLAAGRHARFADTCREGIPGRALLPLEAHYLDGETKENVNPAYKNLPPVQTDVRGEGYLCSGLDLYLTHEPCVCCAMAMVHSRFRICTFINRMPNTGALCAKVSPTALGYGLFWRRELNWRVMTFQYGAHNKNEKPIAHEVFQA